MYNRKNHIAELRRLLVWVVVAAVAMVAGALLYLSVTGDLTVAMTLATIFGAFVSVILGGGLMAAMFFSDKSGHDQNITDATKVARKEDES
ncbi:MAG: hypothetical protein IAF94_16725 [Pirellulaceae bacterium]|nr:hypothetical protein [Pirellulaceae bacterium]